jgi:AcrR family transcriptional regulator
MGTSQRRAREREELREKILNAARALFVQKGFEAVTLRTIAEAIEYSPAALYGYFPDKAALVFTLVNEDFETLAERFGTLARIADPVERLAAIGRTYVGFAVEHPNHYRLMFMSAHSAVIADRPEKYENRGDPARDGYAFLKWTVEQAVAAGRFKPQFADAELACQALWACVHGIAALEVTHRAEAWVDWRPLEQRLHAVVAALLAGMTEPEATRAGTA